MIHSRLAGLSALMTLALAGCGGGDGDATPPPPPPPAVPAVSAALDTSFGQQGQAVLAPAPMDGQPTIMRVQSDGKVLIAGAEQLNTLYTGRAASQVFVTRLLANGQLDTTFGQGGTQTVSLYGGDGPTDLLVLSDGSSVVAYNAQEPCNAAPTGMGCVTATSPEPKQASAWIHLSANGQPIGQSVVLSQQGRSPKLREADGKLLVLTSNWDRYNPFTGSWTLGRYSLSGQLDTGFGEQGLLQSTCATEGSALQVDSTGAIWVAGAIESASGWPAKGRSVCVQHLSANGLAHPSHPAPLVQTLNLNAKVLDLRVLPSQQVVVAGSTNGEQAGDNVYRWQIDPQSAIHGTLSQYSLPANGAVHSMVAAHIDAQGGVQYQGLRSQGPTEKPPFAFRLDADGQLSTTWAQQGWLELTALDPRSWLRAVDGQDRWLFSSHPMAGQANVSRVMGESK